MHLESVSFSFFFFSPGFLLKRVTAFRSLKYQLKTASFFLNKVMHLVEFRVFNWFAITLHSTPFYLQLKPVHCRICEVKGTSTSYHCFGELLNSYTAGWDEYKKIRAFSLVVSVAKLDERTSKVRELCPCGTLFYLAMSPRCSIVPPSPFHGTNKTSVFFIVLYFSSLLKLMTTMAFGSLRSLSPGQSHFKRDSCTFLLHQRTQGAVCLGPRCVVVPTYSTPTVTWTSGKWPELSGSSGLVGARIGAKMTSSAYSMS